MCIFHIDFWRAAMIKMDRRSFLKLAAVTSAAVAFSSTEGKVLRILQPKTEEAASGLTKKYLKCGICGAGCVLVATVDAKTDRVLKVEGDPRDYVSHGTPCVKGKSFLMTYYDPDRLKKPLLRTNSDIGFLRDENGAVIGIKDPKWKEVSWDEAIDLIASKIVEAIKTEGPQSVVFIGHGHGASLASLIGTPNVIKHHSTCHSTWNVTIVPMFSGLPVGELSHSKLIVSFGFDQPGGKSKNPFVWAFAEAKRNGAKVIVFEPRLSGTANLADEWIPIKPGTDAAVAMAMANVIIKEKLYDAEFLARYTNAPLLIDLETGLYPKEGDKEKLLVFDEATGRIVPPGEALKPALIWEGEWNGRRVATAFKLIADTLADKTPEWAAKISGVPADKIREIARELATVKPACIPHWKRSGGTGPGRREGSETYKIVTLLMAMTGNLERLGGWVFNRNAKGAIAKAVSGKAKKSFASVPEKYKGKYIDEREKFPLYAKTSHEGAYQKIWYNILHDKPYKVKVVFIWGQGIQAMFDYSLIEQAINHVIKDNGGIVVNINIYPDEAAALSTIALPEAWFPASKGIGFSKSLDLTARICWVEGVKEYAGEAKSRGAIEKLLAYKIAEKLGIPKDKLENEYFPDLWRLSKKEIWRRQIEAYNKKFKTNITLEQLQKEKVICLPWKPKKLDALATPSGRVEIYSTVMKKHGYNPLPEWKDYFTYTGSLASNEFIVVGSVSPMNRHSKTVNNKWLRQLLKIYHMDTVWLHPSAAARIGVKEGDHVYIRFARSFAEGNAFTSKPGFAVKARVHVTEAIRPDCIFIPHGTGQLSKFMSSYGFGPLGGDSAGKPVLVDYTDPAASSFDMDIVVKVEKA